MSKIDKIFEACWGSFCPKIIPIEVGSEILKQENVDHTKNEASYFTEVIENFALLVSRTLAEKKN